MPKPQTIVSYSYNIVPKKSEDKALKKSYSYTITQ